MDRCGAGRPGRRHRGRSRHHADGRLSQRYATSHHVARPCVTGSPRTWLISRVQEEADEAESQGVNMTHALLSGGAFGKYIEGISTLENLQGGRFPDPEPRRIQRIADRHARPVFFAEPLADDDDWGDYLTQEARAVSWKKLLGMIRVSKRWKKSVKHHLFSTQPPPKGQSVDYATASVLSAAWWELSNG